MDYIQFIPQSLFFYSWKKIKIYNEYVIYKEEKFDIIMLKLKDNRLLFFKKMKFNLKKRKRKWAIT